MLNSDKLKDLFPNKFESQDNSKKEKSTNANQKKTESQTTAT